MGDLFDPKTLRYFREMSPKDAFEEARSAVYQLGAVSSAEFLDVYQELVDQGILSWSQIEDYERRR